MIKEEVLQKKVGNGMKTHFWNDVWFGKQAFRYRFPRLFKREGDPLCRVSDRWSEEGWRWFWHRPITGGVALGQLMELTQLLRDFRCVDKTDGWGWSLDVDGRFSVAGTRDWID